MTTGRAGLPLLLIAALLLLLIALRGWTLVGLRQSQNELDSIETSDHSAQPARTLDRIDALAQQSLSNSQLERLQNLRNDVTRSATISAFSLKWADGSRLPLRDAIRYPLGGSADTTLVALAFDAGAIGNRLLTCSIDGAKQDLGTAAWALPLDLGTETPNQVIEVKVGLKDDMNYSFRLSFLLDRNSPQVSLSTSERPEISAEDQVVGLQAGELLQLKIQDGTLMRRVRVQLDSETLLDRAFERVLEFKLSAPQASALRQLKIEAVDWAGNVLDAHYELRPFEAAAPRLVSAKLGELDLLSGPQRWRETEADVAVQLEGATAATKIRAEFDQAAPATFQAVASHEGAYSAALTFPDGANQLTGRICLERYGKTVTLAELNLVHDAHRPRIDLFDAQGAPVLGDTVAIHQGQSYRLEVHDNDVLDARQEVARFEGGIRLDAPKRERQHYQQQVHVDDSGKLTVVARDLAGNESRREINFTLTAMLGPDDEQGPEVALYSGSTRLDPQENLLFWESPGDLELRVNDSAGVDPESLKLDRLTALTKNRLRPSAAWSLRVSAEANPSVEVADRFGRTSRVSWQIVILNGPAEIKLSAASEAAASWPKKFEWRMPNVAPKEAIRCRLIAPDASESPLEHESLGGRGYGAIPKSLVPVSGSYRLSLELLTPVGAQEIASKSIQLDI